MCDDGGASGGRPAPVVSQQTRFGVINFYVPVKYPYRARTLHTKEPDTLQWIEAFRDGETFGTSAPISACIFVRSFQGHAVLAFEPSPNNYHLLCRNIEINQKSQTIFAYCMAFSDNTKLGSLAMAAAKSARH